MSRQAEAEIEGLYPWFLGHLANLPGYIGRKARKKLIKRRRNLAIVEFRKCVKLLGPGDICLDLGANVGKFTAIMAATGAAVHA